MSVLETPRTLFKGEIAWDPITTNNYSDFYNEQTDQPVYPDAKDRVKAFRQEAIDNVVVPQYVIWNPHGTHRSTFFKTAITGVDLGNGVTGDPFVASPANFTGMLVDLEPYGSYSSQLFFNTMQFGIDGGYRIVGQRATRISDRQVNFYRNPQNTMRAGVASVMWQTSFHKDAQGFRVDAFDSPALIKLKAALEEKDVLGLTVRFSVYFTVYYDNPLLSNNSPLLDAEGKKLQDKLNSGGFQPNPARTMMVGAIGLWRKGEPLNEPGDRSLLWQGVPVLPPSPAGGPPGMVATAFARVDADTLAIDLSNSIPESSRDLTKANLGPLSVVAVDKAGTVMQLGTLDYTADAQRSHDMAYDKTAYEATSGIVRIPLAPGQGAAIADQDLQLRDAQGRVLLAEAALSAIPQVQNLYLDEGTGGIALFQVYNRGVPMRAVVPVTVYTLSADGSQITDTQDMKTDADGVLSFPVPAPKGDIWAYVACPNNLNPPSTQQGGLNPLLTGYMYVRVLAADADVAALPPTWENVYCRVLANWNAMAPCMDNWLMLDDPEQVRAHAGVIKQLTDPAGFEGYFFMPVTRDMTAGGRALLYKFLDAPPEKAAVKAKVAAPDALNFAQLSRSMRGDAR
jgi:hypothetical protein